MQARPLLVRFGALGDMVILTVAIRHLSRRFGQPVDILSSGGWTLPLLQAQPGVGEIYLMSSRKRPYWLSADQRNIVRALRERGAGPTWLFDHDNRKTCWLLERAGWRAEHWCHYAGLQGIPGPHFGDKWLRFAYRNPPILGGEDLPLTASDAYGQLTVSATQRAKLDAWLKTRRLDNRPLILMQVGNKRTMRQGWRKRSSNSKYWPEKNWAAVVRGLRELHSDHAIVLLGVPQEAALNDEILQLAAVADAHNLANDLSIPRLMALAERAAGLISVDTGPAHVAAAVGCPVVVLFGKSEPLMYAPRGADVAVKCLSGTYENEPSILGIDPKTVLEAWYDIHMQPERAAQPNQIASAP